MHKADSPTYAVYVNENIDLLTSACPYAVGGRYNQESSLGPSELL